MYNYNFMITFNVKCVVLKYLNQTFSPSSLGSNLDQLLEISLDNPSAFPCETPAR